MSVGDLLRLHSGSLAELRRRGVIRTANAPAGDYAEWLVAEATGGELAPNAQPSWDVKTPEDLLLQVKARVISDERNHGQRQLSAFRSWLFHAAVVVLFHPDFSVRRATYLPVELLKQPGVSRRSEHVNASIVYATDELLDRGVDWTDRLWEAADPEYYNLSDALQYLGNVAFRHPVPAYKHSAAVFLNLIGRIPSDRTHPRNPQRSPWEAEIMVDCARRLSLF